MDPRGVASELLMKTLSDDAKAILGGCFGPLGMPVKSTLSFGMKQWRPTERAQKALDELVEAGAMVRRDLDAGGTEYIIQLNCSDFGRWMVRNKSKGRWPLTEQIIEATSA